MEDKGSTRVTTIPQSTRKEVSAMGKTTTIVTHSGNVVTGEEIRRTDPTAAKSLGDLALRGGIALATAGLSEFLTMQADEVTVRDAAGNYWTGKETT
jgi:hypothetical protein